MRCAASSQCCRRFGALQASCWLSHIQGKPLEKASLPRGSPLAAQAMPGRDDVSRRTPHLQPLALHFESSLLRLGVGHSAIHEAHKGHHPKQKPKAWLWQRSKAQLRLRLHLFGIKTQFLTGCHKQVQSETLFDNTQRLCEEPKMQILQWLLLALC